MVKFFNYFLFTSLSLIFISCLNQNKSIEYDVFVTCNINDSSLFTILVTSPKGKSLNNLYLETEKLPIPFVDSLIDSDPFIKYWVEDLNDDGYREVYFLTVSAGSGSYGKLHAWSSNRDISVTPIYISQISDSSYAGHDEYIFRDNSILRKFKRYSDNDTLLTDSIVYELFKGEASWQLIDRNLPESRHSPHEDYQQDGIDSPSSRESE